MMMLIIIMIIVSVENLQKLSWASRNKVQICICLLLQVPSKYGSRYDTFGLGRLRSAVAADSSESSPAFSAFNNNSFASLLLRANTYTHTIQVYTPRNKSLPYSILESEDQETGA
jgi:hypothetical protein